ncbi:tetraacyldisaccharide 4'-kinase [Nitratiruptor sp. YY09-18]|uniref:tetraacyldisaccharide 4'-kinase n=1 Tax=Nitratiruptor sp. YY09-18 TaxID=2724901 RepID=UPI0019379D3A|nr:tetraacyldisaccharide 4'-kinase [Nitratiruptor sp. YY09-18]BCD68245.1 tetraacyldisaccharide 4'-kinase [Nitratiruptor sp. YY09-18]
MVSILASPLSLLYCATSISKKLCKKYNPQIPVISIGNLTVGGSGKTPLLIALAKEYEDVAVILRGYKRHSKGLVQVSKYGQILTDIATSGDEAMLLAKSLPHASVYVCEDRVKAIKTAIADGAKTIFLDDAFHHCIKKFDIVIDTNPPNPLCLPAGPYRLPRFFIKFADALVQEGRDFWRKVTIKNPTQKMVLLTAIANPQRLDLYLPKNIKKYHFEDHHYFSAQELEQIWQKEQPTSFLVTSKDLVKLEKFNYPLSLLDLEIEVSQELRKKVEKYIKDSVDAKKDTNSSNTP